MDSIDAEAESVPSERTAVRLELEAVEEQLTQQAEELAACDLRAAAMRLADWVAGMINKQSRTPVFSVAVGKNVGN